MAEAEANPRYKSGLAHLHQDFREVQHRHWSFNLEARQPSKHQIPLQTLT